MLKSDTHALRALEPHDSDLAQALERFGEVQYAEFTEAGHAFWRRSLATAIELRADFEAEGLGQFGENRVKEATEMLASHDQGETRRYLYWLQV